MPCTLYMWEISPPSRAAWMTCKAVGLDFDIKIINLVKGEHKTEEFLKINPSHTIPALYDDGFAIWESHALMPYVVSKYGGDDNPLYPEDPQKRAIVDQYLSYDLDVIKAVFPLFFPPLVQGKDPDPEKAEKLKEMLQNLNDLHLANKKFLTGDHVTIADFSVCSSLTALEIHKYDFDPYGNIRDWLGRMKALPYYAECNEKQFEVADWVRENRPSGQ